MELIFEDKNRRIINDKENVNFASFSAFHLFIIKAREAKNAILRIDNKVIFNIKPSNELQIIYIMIFLQGKNHTLSLERRQKNGSLTLESFMVFIWQPNTQLTLDINNQAEDGERRPWITNVLNKLSFRSLTYNITYSRRKRDSDDVKIIIDNIIQASLLKTIKYKFWRLIGSFLPLFAPTKTETETITTNLPQQNHIIEFVADRMPVLHRLALNFGSPPIPPVRTPTVDDPGWTGDFADDPDKIILARALFGEARNTLVPDQARISIGWVIKNRVKNIGWPKTYWQVITQPLQFSSFNSDDPNRLYVENPLHTGSEIDKKAWEHAYEIAGKIINDEATDPTNGANHYYDDSISAPDWAEGKISALTIIYKNVFGGNSTIFFFKL